LAAFLITAAARRIVRLTLAQEVAVPQITAVAQAATIVNKAARAGEVYTTCQQNLNNLLSTKWVYWTKEPVQKALADIKSVSAVIQLAADYYADNLD